MIENSKNPIIEYKEINDKQCLYFTFKGVFTYKDAESSIVEWKQLMDSRKDEKIIIIWDCLEMKNYEDTARIAWQKVIKELRDKIEMIWLITDSVLIQAGAEIISFFISYTIKVVKSREVLITKINV